jgi:hypothetical protein
MRFPTSRKIRLLVGACVVVGVGAIAPVALAETGGSKTGQTCYKGMYVNYVDPSTDQPFTTEEACKSSLAMNGAVYPLSTSKCFDASWSLIKDQNNGADGSATSGAPCATFVIGGGLLAGVQVTTSGTSISFSYTVSAFAVTRFSSGGSNAFCHSDGSCLGSGGVGVGFIPSPYTYSTSGGLDCTLSGDLVWVSNSSSWQFTTLGNHSIPASVSCTNGTHP